MLRVTFAGILPSKPTIVVPSALLTVVQSQEMVVTNTTSSVPDLLNLCLVFYLLAPKRPPSNISWTLSGSTVSIKWDPVVAKADESAVTGYKVEAARTWLSK